MPTEMKVLDRRVNEVPKPIPGQGNPQMPGSIPEVSKVQTNPNLEGINTVGTIITYNW